MPNNKTNLYISKWWGEYVGGSDDSLTLLDYFEDKQTSELSLIEIFDDLNLTNTLKEDEWYLNNILWKKDNFLHEFYLYIDVIIDISAIVLESLKSKKINLSLLDSNYCKEFSINCDLKNVDLLISKLHFFTENSNPHFCGLGEMMDKDSIDELLTICREISSDLEIAKKEIKKWA